MYKFKEKTIFFLSYPRLLVFSGLSKRTEVKSAFVIF